MRCGICATVTAYDTLGSRQLGGCATQQLQQGGLCVQARRLLRGAAVKFSASKPSLPTYIAAVFTFLFTAFGHRLAKALVYSKVRSELGVQKAVICGGGSLAPHLDDFYESLELPVINGWGLTGARLPCSVERAATASTHAMHLFIKSLLPWVGSSFVMAATTVRMAVLFEYLWMHLSGVPRCCTFQVTSGCDGWLAVVTVIQFLCPELRCIA